MPALITPLDAAGRVRADAVKSLMDHNYRAGVKRFYVAGGTGEGPLLTVAQRNPSRVQDRINRIIQVILGWSCGNVIRPLKTMLQMNGFDAGNALYPASEFTAEMRKRFREELTNAGYVFRG